MNCPHFDHILKVLISSKRYIEPKKLAFSLQIDSKNAKNTSLQVPPHAGHDVRKDFVSKDLQSSWRSFLVCRVWCV